MISTTSPKGTKSFVYEANNMRTETTNIDGSITCSIFGPKCLLMYETNPKAGWSKDYIYLQGHKIAQRNTNLTTKVTTTEYFENDILGSPIAAFNDSYSIVWGEYYSPWGTRLLNKDDKTNTQWYTGKSEDDNLHIDYSGARYHDPTIGRFLSPDPQGFKAIWI